MATANSFVFHKSMENFMDGDAPDWDTAPIAMALLGAANDCVATPAALLLTDLTLDESNDASYTDKGDDGRVTLSTTVSESGGTVTFTASNVSSYTALDPGLDLEGILIFHAATSANVIDDGSSVPLVWVEFASAIDPGGSDFTITWNASGIVTIANS